MSGAKYNQKTRDWYTKLLDGKTTEEKIESLELAERQKYHYYCDCSANFTTEQDADFNSQWNEILEMIKELKESLKQN